MKLSELREIYLDEHTKNLPLLTGYGSLLPIDLIPLDAEILGVENGKFIIISSDKKS